MKRMTENVTGKMMKRGGVLIFSLLFLGFVFSCAIPDAPSQSSITLPDFQGLDEGAYRGGSVIYNAGDPATNQLIDGMNIPVRFAGLTPYYDQEKGLEVLAENTSSIGFGIVHIVCASPESIKMIYFEYTDAGATSNGDNIELSTGESCDLDRDGDLDIMYSIPAKVRPGFENARYLSFLSSEEGRTTCMYRLGPENYPGNRYPSGIIGVNPSGSLLVLEDAFETTTRSTSGGTYTGSAIMNSLTANDFIISCGENAFERVTGISGTRAGTSVSTVNDKALTASEVYEVMYFHLEGDLETIMNKYNETDTRAYFEIFSYNYNYYFFNNSAGYLKFGNNFSFGIDLNASISVTWCNVSGSMSAALRVSDTASIQGYLGRDYSFSKKVKLWEPQRTFYVYGVPFDVRLPINVGVDLSAGVSASFYTDVSVSATAGFGSSFYAGIFPPWASVSAYPIFSLSTSYTPPSFSLNPGSVTVTPYLEINPSVKIAGAVTPQCENRFSIECYANSSGSLRMTLKIKSDAYIDFLGIIRPSLGTLINYSRVLYSR